MTRIAGRALLGAGAIALLALLFSGRVAQKMPDLEVYWHAAARARAAEPLYRTTDQHYQFKYLPAFAILAMPMAQVSIETAKAAWFGVSVVLIAALIWLSLQLLPERRRTSGILVIITLVAMGKFYGHELVLGQMNTLLGVIGALAVLSLARGSEAAGGALVALAIVVKPYAVIFVPWLAGRRRWPSIAAALLGLGIVLALPAVRYGWDGNLQLHREWWRTVTDTTAPNLTNADNISIAAMFAKWIGTSPMATGLTVAVSGATLAAVLLVFLRRRGVQGPDGLEGSLLLTCIPLLSPQGWDYVFLISTPAIVFLANYEDRLPAPLRLVTIAAVATIGLSLFDIMGRAAYSAFMAWSVVTVCYLVVVGALCTLRWRQVA